MRLLTIPIVVLAALAAPAHAANDTARWIHGSWVNVRSGAGAGSAVIDHVVTNTPVVLRARQGASCEVGWTKDSTDAHGFVPCTLLGDRPLALADVASSVRPMAATIPITPRCARSGWNRRWSGCSTRAAISPGRCSARNSMHWKAA